MRKVNLIKTKTLDEVAPKYKGKILPILETATLDWAKASNPEALEATLKVKGQESKYFKYLRRLLELKLEETQTDEPSGTNSKVSKELIEALMIETLRVPEFLSCTQLGMYDTCKRKYYFRYLLGIKTPKTSALHFGSAVDNALNLYFEEKLAKRNPPIAAVYGAFFEAFDKEKDKVIWGEDNAAQLLKKGPKVIDAFLDAFADKIKPVAVQKNIKIHLDNNGLLTGAIDVMEENAIIDNKTSKDLWDTEGRFAKHTKELQPRAYTLAFFEEFQRMPKEFKYCIVTKEEVPQTQFISFPVSKEEIFAFKANVQGVWDEIMTNLPKGKEAFPPEAIKSRPKPLCCEQYCEFSSYCIEDGLKIAKYWDKENKRHVYE